MSFRSTDSEKESSADQFLVIYPPEVHVVCTVLQALVTTEEGLLVADEAFPGL